MNIEQGLEENMKEISAVNGVCLSLEERIKLITMLSQLKSDIKCDEMQLWGKIIGAEKDYYISKALYYKGFQNFPKKKYFSVQVQISYLVNCPTFNRIILKIFINLIHILLVILILF